MKRSRRESMMRRERERWVAPLLVVVLGVVAYSNSLTGPFVFDDKAAIEQNPQIRVLNPFGIAPLQRTTIQGRPMLIFSFAADFRIGRLKVGIYHITNLAIHVVNGLLLYGIVRRTLLQMAGSGPGFLRSATCLAAAIAAIWVVHPLTTQSVTYVVQRAESLAGMFLLASIYCVIRSATGSKSWQLGAVVACALGMASKEVVAVLPMLALLYDRTFLAGSFGRALRLRWKMYAGMMLGYGCIAYSLHAQDWGKMAGTGLGVSSLEYARTESNVIAHYVALAFWPVDLSLDYYGWPIARHWGDVTAWGWIVLAGAIVCLAMVRFKPWLGFLGVWFFGILAPTSSLLPIVDESAAEQRMYLPLAAIVAAVVVGVWVPVQRWKWARGAVVSAGIATVFALSWLTMKRNEVYGSAIDIWTDTVAKRPNNARAHANLGEAWAQASIEFQADSAQARAAAREAAEQYRVAMNLEPQLVGSVFALGQSLVRIGDAGAAEALYTEQLPLHPEVAADLYVERGTLRAQRGDWGEAKADFEAAIEREPGDVEAHYFLGVVCQQIGDLAGAKRELEKVVEISPGFRDASKRLRELEREK